MLDNKVEFHIPVLLKETIEVLKVKSNGIYLDATIGGGGHFREIASMLDNNGIIIGIDKDSEAIEWNKNHPANTKAKVIIEKCSFSSFDLILKKYDIPAIDGLLLDLGVSSHQIDNMQRGFSYMKNSPLDMRMDTSLPFNAKTFCSQANEEQLAEVLGRYGEIKNPLRMARTIIKFRENVSPIKTSYDLIKCLKLEYGGYFPIKIIARIFQALRIAVNNELEELKSCLNLSLLYVKKGGRIAVISYHSLEDRIVKNFFRDKSESCTCSYNSEKCICGKNKIFKRINKKVIKPTIYEIKRNPRSRSARLRAVEKIN